MNNAHRTARLDMGHGFMTSIIRNQVASTPFQHLQPSQTLDYFHGVSGNTPGNTLTNLRERMFVGQGNESAQLMNLKPSVLNREDMESQMRFREKERLQKESLKVEEEKRRLAEERCKLEEERLNLIKEAQVKEEQYFRRLEEQRKEEEERRRIEQERRKLEEEKLRLELERSKKPESSLNEDKALSVFKLLVKGLTKVRSAEAQDVTRPSNETQKQEVTQSHEYKHDDHGRIEDTYGHVRRRSRSPVRRSPVRRSPVRRSPVRREREHEEIWVGSSERNEFEADNIRGRRDSRSPIPRRLPSPPRNPFPPTQSFERNYPTSPHGPTEIPQQMHGPSQFQQSMHNRPMMPPSSPPAMGPGPVPCSPPVPQHIMMAIQSLGLNLEDLEQVTSLLQSVGPEMLASLANLNSDALPALLQQLSNIDLNDPGLQQAIQLLQSGNLDMSMLSNILEQNSTGRPSRQGPDWRAGQRDEGRRDRRDEGRRDRREGRRDRRDEERWDRMDEEHRDQRRSSHGDQRGSRQRKQEDFYRRDRGGSRQNQGGSGNRNWGSHHPGNADEGNRRNGNRSGFQYTRRPKNQ